MGSFPNRSRDLEKEIARAFEAGTASRQNEPVARAARYDKKSRRVIVHLATGISFMFPVRCAEGLSEAAPADFKIIEITPSVQGLYWPTLDVDLTISGLLQGVFGTKRWMAQRASPRVPRIERNGETTVDGPSTRKPATRKTGTRAS